MAISSDIQQQVFDLLSRTSNLSFVGAEQETTGSLGLIPGQRVTAEVLAMLPDSRVQVRIGTERFNLNLPVAARQGQSLELTFVSSEPRSTFAIARPGGISPPVSLTDASRLLGLLTNSEQIADPQLRSSMQSVAGMLRRSSGESGLLANLMDEALTYGETRQGESIRSDAPRPTGVQATPDSRASQGEMATPQQLRLVAFESSASQILQQIARNSRFVLIEAANQPVVPLQIPPGQEVDAAVRGTLPGGRAFVLVAGTMLELTLPRPVTEGEILRLTVISNQPKPVFALSRLMPEAPQGILSEAARWLSVLEHGEGEISSQQRFVLDRLTTVLKSLPPDSAAFTAIQDEAITYRTFMEGRRGAAEQVSGEALLSMPSRQVTLQQGKGIVLGDDVSRLLQSLIRGNRLALLEALNQQAQPAPFAAGERLKGEVFSPLDNGRFMVGVGDRTFEFSLPKGIHAGNRVTLFFITNDPKPTFLLTRFGMPGDSHVSQTGRWLTGFLETAPEKMPAREVSTMSRVLLDGPPADPVLVGAALRRGVRESGLFYESHLASWFSGDYPLDDIMREPQGRLSRLKQAEITLPAGGGPAEEPVPVSSKHASLEAMEAAFRKAGTISDQDEAIDQRTLPVVREQLATLQSGQVVYQGELLTGQPFKWSISERENRRTSEGEQERSWNTVLRIDLPFLGAVTARLTLDGHGVDVDLRAGEAGSVLLLEQGREELREQLLAAGLKPGEIGVRHEPA